MTPHEWTSFFEKHPIVVMLGSGGVGKTSSSIALALVAARCGKRVGLLSIDPARRLADALGLQMNEELHQVPLPAEIPGEIWATMLDQAQVFERMVRRYADSPQHAQLIFEHPIYKATSTKLSGALEYMALAKLQEMVASKKFQVIIVDTPPDLHAVEFLSRPNLLGSFFDSKVMSWLVKPFHVATRLGLGKLFSVGERLMGGIARVTGFQTLKLLSEFLVLAHKVLDGFHASSQDIFRTLQGPQTLFTLVMTPQSNSVRSALFLAKELKAIGFRIQCVMFNRVMSDELMKPLETCQFVDTVLPRHPERSRGIPTSQGDPSTALGMTEASTGMTEASESDLGSVYYKRYTFETQLMKRCLEDLATNMQGFHTFQIPDLGYPLHDLSAMISMSKSLLSKSI